MKLVVNSPTRPYTALNEDLSEWFVSPERTEWGPLRNLYYHKHKQLFLFWSASPGRGWSIGPSRDRDESFQNSEGE